MKVMDKKISDVESIKKAPTYSAFFGIEASYILFGQCIKLHDKKVDDKYLADEEEPVTLFFNI